MFASHRIHARAATLALLLTGFMGCDKPARPDPTAEVRWRIECAPGSVGCPDFATDNVVSGSDGEVVDGTSITVDCRMGRDEVNGTTAMNLTVSTNQGESLSITQIVFDTPSDTSMPSTVPPRSFNCVRVREDGETYTFGDCDSRDIGTCTLSPLEFDPETEGFDATLDCQGLAEDSFDTRRVNVFSSADFADNPVGLHFEYCEGY